MSHRNSVLVVIALVVVGAALFAMRPERPIVQDRKVAETKPAPVQEQSKPTTVAPEPVMVSPTDRPSASAATAPMLVGRQVCKECHAENFELHGKHGHASTFAVVETTEVSKSFDGKSFDAGEPYGSYSYHAKDGRLFATLPHKFGDEPFPLQYALGSGHKGITFLTLVPEEGGNTAGLEHRVSLYAHDELGISPGHENKSPRDGIEFFGNSIRGEPLDKCVYCHTTSAKIINQNIVDLVPSVNCEKCHGPGSEHVRQARASKTPPPFSIGRDDWDTESELQLCGDCHRMPRDLSEKEVREYPDLLVRFQPVGLLRSRCYLESAGALKCTTCHNPHETIQATTNAAQVKNCVNCHVQDSADHVACPVSPREGCIECHMPVTEQGHGLTFHDHWIRVRGDD